MGPSVRSIAESDDADGGVPVYLEAQATTPVVKLPPTPAAFVRSNEPTAAPLLPRGVFVTPWLMGGRRMILVIDHTHSLIHAEPVIDNGDRDAQVQSLRVMLMALDPGPLKLVDN